MYICKYIVDIHNDIFISYNVFLDSENYILDIWNNFSFWISEMNIVTCNNWIEISEMPSKISIPSKNSMADIQNEILDAEGVCADVIM